MKPKQAEDTDTAIRWRHIYIAVIAFTAVVFAFLYLFSRYFAG